MENSTMEDREIARAVSRELHRQLPDVVARHLRNPLRVNNGPARMRMPELQYDGKTAIWVGCHQDEKGAPLVCIEVGGQIVPISSVDGLERLIRSYRDHTRTTYSE